MKSKLSKKKELDQLANGQIEAKTANKKLMWAATAEGFKKSKNYTFMHFCQQVQFWSVIKMVFMVESFLIDAQMGKKFKVH